MSDHRDFALDLAGRAAETARRYFNAGVHAEWKQDESPVTIADTEINAMVIERVRERFPEHRIIGEEESYGDENAEYAWVCDPIDGTIPFTSGYPTFAFSLALVHNGHPVLAVTVDPMLDRTFVAEPGAGATMNTMPISVAPPRPFEQILISVEGRERDRRAETLRRRLDDAGAMQCRIQSCIYAGMLVAAGRIGAMVYGWTKPWDAAAVSLLVTEAGGIATDLDGNQQRYDGPVNGLVVAATPELHSRLIELLAPDGR